MSFCLKLTVLLLLILPTAGFASESISLRVGIFPFEPLNFVDSQGDAQGLFPDLIREVADKEGWELTFVSGTWSENMERLRSGKIDLLTSVAFTPERTLFFDFNTVPVVDIWGQVFLEPSSGISNFRDLQDQKVAVVAGDINAENFIRVSKELGVVSQIVEYPTHSEVFRAVANKEAIAAISAQHYGVKHAADLNLVTSSLRFSPMSLYLAGQKNRSLSFLAQIDTHFSVWKADKDSVYYERLAHWLGSKVSVRYIVHWWMVGCLLLAIASVVLLIYLNKHLREKAKRVQSQLEFELRQSQKMEAIGTLAGGIAHDFNNILTSMIGCTEMAMKRCGGDERLRKYLNLVRDGERRAAELVSQILTFSRQDETLDRRPLQFSETLLEVIKLLRSSLPSSIDFHVTIDKTCRPVQANSSQLHQVIMNLVTNACQALPGSKGRLDIALKEEFVGPRSEACFHNMKPGKYLVLSVQDNGLGMAPKQIERIFDPYFTTRHMTGGTGLGLSIVQKIVQSHKGIVLVESTQGEGSLFRVYLPTIKPDAIPAPNKEKTRVQKTSGSERVLLIDDEEGIAHF